MEGTPRLRSAFPATPQTKRRSGRFSDSAGIRQAVERLPQIPAAPSTVPSSSPGEPLIPEHIIDAPSQRLYACALWVALWCWKAYDFSTLQESEEQSLWLFMKWVAIDGIFLFGLPSMRIPWLEWSSSTMLLLFSAHAFTDGMMMFRIPLPVAAGFAALSRSVWGVYEMAINEVNVNPRTIEYNESLILGRQIIHILPEGSAILNAESASYCIDASRTDVKLPITINSTSPISMELLRIDLDTDASETIHVSKSQIKTMHKEASRLVTYGEKPNEPKTLYYTVKKPGLYALGKVVDESNLEVARKQMAHTVVVPCPKAKILPTTSDRCKGEVSDVNLEVVGTPPMRVKYRKKVNQQPQEATFESIQPEDFASPLVAADRQLALSIPHRVDTVWARPQKVQVPLSEGLSTAGNWLYSIAEVTDGFGNKVTYTDRDYESQEKHAKASQLHQKITVHERPVVNLHGCSPQQPLKVAKGSAVNLPVQFGSTSGRGAISDSAHHVEYIFSPQHDRVAGGGHSEVVQQKKATIKDITQRPLIQEAGLYTITGVFTDFCRGEVLEPASCLLQNPPEPQLSISSEAITDKCAGSPIGLRVDLDLVGTPPFKVHYRVQKKYEHVHTDEVKDFNGLRGQIELTPTFAGDYTYSFFQVSDAVYKARALRGLELQQSVKPAASAALVNKPGKRVACIDESSQFDVALQGEGPFTLEYELVHNGRRAKDVRTDVNETVIRLQTPALTEGGDYTLALVSITDGANCKEFLKDEAKISVRHQKPKAAFGQIEGRRTVDMLEGKSAQLPVRLAGEGPWTVKYLDAHSKPHDIKLQNANDRIPVTSEGVYQLENVNDAVCPGEVDEAAKTFEVSWIARPEVRVALTHGVELVGTTYTKPPVCEGEEDAVEVLFKGAPPFHLHYTEHVKPERGVAARKDKELRGALNVASMHLVTALAGDYEYKFTQLRDANYDPSARHFTPVTVRQKVLSRPSVAFANPGKSYSYCSIDSPGEEVIPIILHGQGPFDVEYEIKHHSGKPETVKLNSVEGPRYDIKIPHSRVQLGKSRISLRRVSDHRGCSRLLESTTPHVQIAVYDAPTISPLENHDNFCVGDHVNFALSGVAPFNVFYNFQDHERKAIVTGTTFRRLAEKPGTFTVVGVEDSASRCRAGANITRHIHGMPSVRVSHGRESYVDIHEGGETEILFEFGGVPPFEFTYTRSSNTEKGGKKKGVILDMRHEVSEDYSMRVRAGEEGTYEVVAIRDRYCAYAKPGVKTNWKEAQKRLQY